MGNSDCDGIRRIGWWCLAHSEQDPDHEGDLPFVSSSTADHGLFDAPWRIFMHGQTAPDGCQYHRTARGTEGDRGLIALNVNDALNRHRLRFMLLDDVGELLVKRKQAAGRLNFRAVSNDSKIRARKPLFLPHEHSVAGCA